MEEFEKNSPQKNDPEILVTNSAPAPRPTPAPRPAAKESPSVPRPVRVARRAPSAPAAKPVSVAKPAPAAKPVSVAKPASVAKPVSVAKPTARKKPAPKTAGAPFGGDTISMKGLVSDDDMKIVKDDDVKIAGEKLPVEEPKKEAKKKEKPAEEKDASASGGAIVSVLKALIYIAFVLVVSGFLAVYGIRVANDIFAFVKDEMTVEVTVGEGATLEDVSELLYSEGLVESADWFRLYTGFKYRDRDLEFVAGTYTLNSTMNYNTLISSLTPKSGREIVSILIPEGYNVDQIIDLLVSEGIGTREGYVHAIQNYDYNYEFLDVLDSIEKKNGRRYRLEGYLFPAKYDVYRDSSEIAVIDKMLAAFQANFTETYSDRLTELDMNMDEIVTLASIIQAEARYSSDMYYISGVFHNRLNNSATFPKLDSDATVLYALIDEALPTDRLSQESPYDSKYEHKAELTKDDLRVQNPYNTYQNNGLTPGAICNPGLEAITAALYPEDKLMETRGVKSYYFVAGVDGYSLYGANQAEHDNNIAKVEADKAAAANG